MSGISDFSNGRFAAKDPSNSAVNRGAEAGLIVGGELVVGAGQAAEAGWAVGANLVVEVAAAGHKDVKASNSRLECHGHGSWAFPFQACRLLLLFLSFTLQ